MLFSWYIVWYLFLAGVGSGAFLWASGTAVWDAIKMTPSSQRTAKYARGGYVLSPVLMTSAALFLILDVGKPQLAWEILLNPFQSLVSVGACLVALFTVLAWILCVAGLSAITPNRLFMWVGNVLGMVLAAGVMLYTGLLLGGMVSVDFWHTPLLPVLFAFSSLSTGIAAVVVFGTLVMHEPVSNAVVLWKAAAVLSVCEAICLAVFLGVGMTATDTSQASCRFLFVGDGALAFWAGTVAVGIVIPLVLHASSQNKGITAGVAVGCTATLVGGLALRWCVVAAGQLTAVVPLLL